jgi:hypothetical protein
MSTRDKQKEALSIVFNQQRDNTQDEYTIQQWCAYLLGVHDDWHMYILLGECKSDESLPFTAARNYLAKIAHDKMLL